LLADLINNVFEQVSTSTLLCCGHRHHLHIQPRAKP
jgi:hypothetical protein